MYIVLGLSDSENNVITIVKQYHDSIWPPGLGSNTLKVFKYKYKYSKNMKYKYLFQGCISNTNTSKSI